MCANGFFFCMSFLLRKEDVSLLAKANLMDYSLLIGISENTDKLNNTNNTEMKFISEDK